MEDEKLKSLFKPSPTVKDVPMGLVISRPATSVFYKTGDWGALLAVIDKDKCTKCALCWAYCPDSCVRITEDGYYEVDPDFCKGCGICAEECPPKAITMVARTGGPGEGRG